jgi:hypothetical protein
MSNPKPALTAFLSHKYKAPAVNDYFFRLFSRTANVEFEVDEGSLATNVTRLERLIRDADAFIGIYPFDEGGPENPTAADLTTAARYFRLELDIAARARKPGLVLGSPFSRHHLVTPAYSPGIIRYPGGYRGRSQAEFREIPEGIWRILYASQSITRVWPDHGSRRRE